MEKYMADTLTLQQFLPYRFANLAEKISVSLSRIYVDSFGINVAEWRILATLGEFGELQAKQVARHSNMDKVRVSRAVASLTTKDLLDRRPCPGDSRGSLLHLSPAGRRLYLQLVPQALCWEQALVEPLSEEERRLLSGVLDRLESGLDARD
jgi:DNA-binding MarR family transcriptional regulator